MKLVKLKSPLVADFTAFRGLMSRHYRLLKERFIPYFALNVKSALAEAPAATVTFSDCVP